MDKFAQSSNMVLSGVGQQAAHPCLTGFGWPSSNAVYHAPVVAQPPRLLDNTRTSSPSQLPPQAMLRCPSMTATGASQSFGQHFYQQTEATNVPHVYFPACPQSLHTFDQLGMTSSRYDYPPSSVTIPQSLYRLSTPDNGVSRMQTHIQSPIAQPDLPDHNTDCLRVYSYEQFHQGEVNNSRLPVAVDTFPAQPYHTNPTPEPSMVSYGNDGSTQHRFISANPNKNTQNSRNSIDYASADIPWASAQALTMPNGTAPGMEGNNAPSNVVQLKETIRQYAIETPLAQTACSVAPNPVAASLPSQLSMAGNQRTSGSVRCAATKISSAKRLKIKDSASTPAKSQSCQTFKGVPPLKHSSMPRHTSLESLNGAITQDFNKGYDIQQPSDAENSPEQSLPRAYLLFADSHSNNVAANADSKSQCSLLNDTKQNGIGSYQLTHSQICIESSLEKMLELSGALKNKTMPRTEVLKEMDDIRNLVEGSIRDWHRVLGQKEDMTLTDMRMVHSLTPFTYD